MTDVTFLAQLAAGASADRLEPLWQEARRDGLYTLRRSASRTGLLPALGRFLAARDLPDPADTELAAICFGAEERSAASIRLLADAAQAGTARGIAVKGAALVLAGFYEPGERQSMDADLLISPREVAAWKSAFEASGAAWERLPRNGYEIATAVRGPAVVEIHVALPEGSGRRAGPTFDTIFARSVKSRVRAIFVPDRAACREIAVHHFVFHHLGSAAHALRVVQDLARLEDETADSAAELGRFAPSPSKSIALLRRVTRKLREGEIEDEEAARFLSGVKNELLLERPDPTFSESAAAILSSERTHGRSAIRAIFAALVPPADRLRRRASEPVAVTAVRYAARPLSLAARWLFSAAGRPERRRREAWKRFLGGD